MNENNNVTENKNRVLKSLAIVGFIGLLLIIAWLGVKMISLAPNAISSLASLADSVYNYDPDTKEPVDLIVVANKTITNNDEPVTISWNTPRPTGTYTFSYACVDGVSLDLRTGSDGIQTIACDTNYNVGSVNSIDVSINSEKNRFTDVPYSIAFIPTAAEEPTGTKESSVTVVNPSISPIVTTDDETPTEPAEEVVTTPEPAPSTPTTPVTPTTPGTPTYTQEYVYQIPVSNPNGYTDLAVRLLGVGTLNNRNEYTNSGSLTAGERGAIQIEVKNNGTKTSNTWEYAVNLPTGVEYTADDQTALRPNERVVLTIGFTVPSTLTGTQNFNGSVDTRTDNNPNNDRFSSSVIIR